MQSQAGHDAREWIARADEDLQVAGILLGTAPPHLGSAAYHAQQAAEKALKAFLTVQGMPFRPTHDLVELRRHCEQVESGFAQFATASQFLTPYATRFRYPGGPLHPTQAEATQAQQDADSIVRFVRQLLGV